MYPTLNLQFARSRFPDPRITFARASTGTYIDALGRVRTAAINQPRFDWDPVTGQCLGLLIEEGRTNWRTYSEQFDNAVWNKTNANVVANAAVAPDGTLGAEKLVCAVTPEGSYHYVSGPMPATLSGNTTYIASIYARAGEWPYLIIQTGGGDWATVGISAGAQFDLATGQVVRSFSGVSVDDTGIQAIGGGWYRCWVRYTSVASPSGPVSILFIIGNSPISRTAQGDGVSGLYIWGAQFEAGAFPSPYIKTEDAPATRAADTAYVDGEGWLNPAEGTIVVEVREPTGESPTTNLLTLSNGASNSNRYSLQGTGSTQTLRIVRSLDGTHAYADLGSRAPRGQWNCVAFGYSSAGLTVAANGEVVVNSATMTTPNSLSRLYLGGSYAGPFPCWIRRVQYYPVRLSPDELVRITK